MTSKGGPAVAVRSGLLARGAQPGQGPVACSQLVVAALVAGAVQGLAGPGHVDVVGDLGLLGEDRYTVPVDREEPAVDGDPQLLAAVLDDPHRVPGLERAEQR